MNNQLILDNLPRCDNVGRFLARQTGQVGLEEDLIAAARYGLVCAARKYSPSLGDFVTFSNYRIWGAAKDELRHYAYGHRHTFVDELLVREGDSVPRNMPRVFKSFEEFGQFSFDAVVGTEEDPLEKVVKEDLVDHIWEAIVVLDQKEKDVVVYYFVSEWTQSKIAGMLGVTKSRVSQILTKAVKKMRRHLKREGIWT